jgi:hypothetical protein
MRSAPEESHVSTIPEEGVESTSKHCVHRLAKTRFGCLTRQILDMKQTSGANIYQLKKSCSGSPDDNECG